MTTSSLEVAPGLFTSPEPAPVKGTLLDVASTIEGRFSSQDTTGMFPSYNCMSVDTLAVLPCPPNFLGAPTQTAPATATTGGTLAAGTYRAKITAINTRGETVASGEQSQVTTGSTSTVTWNWNAVAGATGYKVYVTNGASNSETFLVQVGAVTTYVWTGTPAFSAGNVAPPTSNTATVPVIKSFNDGPVWQDAIKFAVYAGVTCKMVGFDAEDAFRQMQRAFTATESVGVARALMIQRFVVSAGHWAAPTDIIPIAGAVDPGVGLALLEGHAMNNYAGQPTIHMGRTIGSLVTRNGQAEMQGNMLVSSLGSKIAADAGYEFPNQGPTGAAPAAGEQWIYASGEVTVAPSEIIHKGGMDLVETTDSNRFRALLERAYIATVDCYAAAVRVKVQ